MHRVYNKVGLFILATFLFSSCLTMKKADHAFEVKQYAAAANMYSILLEKSDDKMERQHAAFQAGEANRMNHDPRTAQKFYDRAIKYGVKDPIILFRLAEVKMQQGKFEEALVEFKKYQKEAPGDPRTEVLMKGCESAMKWQEEKTRYKIETFKPANENGSDDFCPMWADRKSNTIMFTSDRPSGASREQYGWTGRMHSDVWQIKLEGKKGKEKWGNPELVEGLNTKYNDGVVTFNKRFSLMYFTQCNGVNGKEQNCKIYEARRVGTGWQIEPEPLDFCKADGNRWNYGHPTLSEDEKTMYFSSDRPGGFADTLGLHPTKDLWMVTYVRRGRTWSDPINLGPSINTSGNETFPYMHSDGTLYFSSDGHAGMGGLDLFESSKTGEGPTDWSVPKNMKSPINSSYDDFGIIMEPTKEHGFFSSNRVKEKDDIYEFYMDPIVCTLKGQVTDCDSGVAIPEALVLISNNIDTNKIRLYTDERGYYETPLSINTNYTIDVSKRENYYYDAKSQYVSTMDVQNSLDCQHVKDFCLKNTCNDVFVLPIYYDLDKAFIREDAKPVLSDLVETLKKYPKMKVELGSHTDCRSDYAHNRALSQRRADSAIAYIVDKGNINPFRLEARGYGESQLVNHCECEGGRSVPCTEEEHQKNRRTTVKVVNCNFDVLSIGIDYMLRNDSALMGQGSVYSPYLLEKQRQYIIDTKGNIDSFLAAREYEEKRQKEIADSLEYVSQYDIIPLNKSRNEYYVYGNIGRKRIKFSFNGEERRTEISQDMVEQLLNAEIITVANFSDGNEKTKFSNGMKVYSTSFTIPEITIGDIVFTKVRCKMVEDRGHIVLGYNAFNDYVDFEIKDDKIWLLKEPE